MHTPKLPDTPELRDTPKQRDTPELRSAPGSAEQRRDEVMSFLSHDMRSPLSSILALLELHALDPDSHPAAAVHAQIADLARGALELNELFGRVAAAETKVLAHAVLDPADLCAVAADAAWEFAGAKNIGIDVVSAPEAAAVALVRGDHDLLNQALVHLLTALARNSAGGSRLTLAWGTDHQGVSIEVAGPGQGFSAADTLAAPAAKLHGSNPGAKRVPPKVAAAQLEMALATIVAQRHGGRMAFDHAPETGARFSMVLPLHQG